MGFSHIILQSTIQHAREFIVIFACRYDTGFGLGFNCAKRVKWRLCFQGWQNDQHQSKGYKIARQRQRQRLRFAEVGMDGMGFSLVCALTIPLVTGRSGIMLDYQIMGTLDKLGEQDPIPSMVFPRDILSYYSRYTCARRKGIPPKIRLYAF